MPASPHPRHTEAAARVRLFVAVLGGCCAVLGCIVLIGWHLHLPALIQLQPGTAPTKYNTALCFVLAGLALAAWAFGRAPLATPILGASIAALGGMTLAEYLFHADLGIDQALFRAYIYTETSDPGRMSPVTAFSFLLAGLCLVLLSIPGAARWRAAIAGSAASGIISISLVALAGYLFGLAGTNGWGELTRVAFHTAAGLGLVGIGIFTIAWNLALAPDETTPRWLPAPMALGIFTGSLVLFFALTASQDSQTAQTVKFGAESASNQITSHIDSRIRGFVRMAQLSEFGAPPGQQRWELDAAYFLRHSPDVKGLAWIDPNFHTRWVVPASPTAANPATPLDPRERAALDQAARERQPVLTRILSIPSIGFGFILFVPIVANGHSNGFIAATFDAYAALRRYIPSTVAPGESIEIFDGTQKFFSRDVVASSSREDLVEQDIDLPGVTWNLQIWPSPPLAARLASPLPSVVLVAGLVCSILLGGLCYFAQRSSRQATETRRANAALQAALDTVKTLEGLLPICSSCKRVREDDGYWSQIDTYIYEHTNASLSHGYCPECAAKAFQDCGFEVPAEVQAAIDIGNFEQSTTSLAPSTRGTFSSKS